MQHKAQPITMVRGTTNTIRVTVADTNGNPYALSGGNRLIFGVKTNLNNSNCCIKKVITEGTGVYEFRLSPADTEHLPCKTLRYDVGLQIGQDYFPVIPCSPFTLTPNVTGREV